MYRRYASTIAFAGARSGLLALESRVMAELGGVRIEVANLATELHRTVRTSTLTSIGAMAALVTLAGSISALL